MCAHPAKRDAVGNILVMSPAHQQLEVIGIASYVATHTYVPPSLFPDCTNRVDDATKRGEEWQNGDENVSRRTKQKVREMKQTRGRTGNPTR